MTIVIARRTVQRKPRRWRTGARKPEARPNGDARARKKAGYAFISYSSENRVQADAVRDLLREEQTACWMAPYDIPAGSKYAYEINNALENCACLVLLLSEAAQNSPFVEREVELAMAYRKSIVAIALEEMQLNPGFKFYLGEEQLVPVRKIDARTPELRKVLERVRRLTAGGGDRLLGSTGEAGF